jgi:hypothetical protein
MVKFRQTGPYQQYVAGVLRFVFWVKLLAIKVVADVAWFLAVFGGIRFEFLKACNKANFAGWRLEYTHLGKSRYTVTTLILRALYRGYTGATGRYSRYILVFCLKGAPTRPDRPRTAIHCYATISIGNVYTCSRPAAVASGHGASLQAALQKRLLMKIYSTENGEEPLLPTPCPFLAEAIGLRHAGLWIIRWQWPAGLSALRVFPRA